MNKKKREIFKDPVHNWVSLNVDRFTNIFKKECDRKEIAECIQSLIITKEFSRLIDIKQLGAVGEIFPGATHNRFSHSIGVFHLAKVVLTNNKNIKWSEDEALLFLFGSLLHDVGHGFYSHTFEVFVGDSRKYSHEKMTARIISDKNLGIYNCFAKYKYKKLKDLPEKLERFFFSKKGDEFKKVRALLSSQLDVDRLDYLMRDSHHSGVNYKFGEAELILKYARWNSEKEIIYFNENLQSTIIHYLLTRFQMHKAVYMHNDSLFKDAIMYFIGEQIRLKDSNVEGRMLDIAVNPNKIEQRKFINYTDSWARQEFKRIEENSNTSKTLSTLISMFFNISLPMYKICSKETILKDNSEATFKKKISEAKNKSYFTHGNRMHFLFKITPINWYKDSEPLYIEKEDGSIVKLERNIINTSYFYNEEEFMYWTIKI